MRVIKQRDFITSYQLNCDFKILETPEGTRKHMRGSECIDHVYVAP
jgi:hypothetical protein